MSVVFRIGAAATAAVAALTIGPASGAVAHRTRFTVAFTSRQVASSTGIHVTVSITDPSDPRGKAPQLVKAVLTLPKGTVVNTGAAPRCTASDTDFTVRGTTACPDDTRVGSGTVEGDTGFGSPVDPISGDDNVFNGTDQIIEAVSVPGSPLVVAVDRLIQAGDTFTAHPPAPPGGPPDGRTHLRSIDFLVPARGAGKTAYVTTPSGCPRAGSWTTTGTFTYADGVSETVSSTTPCRRRR